MTNTSPTTRAQVQRWVALQWHLTSNCYPPRSQELIPYCEAAIAACVAEEPTRVVAITLADGKQATLLESGRAVLAGELCEELRLWEFVEWDRAAGGLSDAERDDA